MPYRSGHGLLLRLAVVAAIVNSAAAARRRSDPPHCPEFNSWEPECWAAANARIAIGSDRSVGAV